LIKNQIYDTIISVLNSANLLAIMILEVFIFIQNNLVLNPKLPEITQEKILHFDKCNSVLIMSERRFVINKIQFKFRRKGVIAYGK